MKSTPLALLASCAALLAACAALPPPEPAPPPGGLVAWHTLAEGKTRAAAEKKPLLVDYFVPTGCNRCERMDRALWADPEIARRVNGDFVPVRVDLSKPMTDDEKALGARYDFNFDCLLLFLDPGGKVLEKAGGGRMCFAEFVDTQWFLGLLAQARAAATP